jgi:hypothetical protein
MNVPGIFISVLLILLPVSMNNEQAIKLAMLALSQSLQLNEKDMVIEKITPVQWADTSLGCPQPGMMYAQMITEGFKIIIKVEDKVYPVHTGAGRAVVCTGKGKILPKSN